MKELLVFGDRTFKITVPEDAKITFGPWSPPNKSKGGWTEQDARGTLRVYGKTKEDILAVFSGVKGFRDLSLGYKEKVAQEVGDTIWHDDEKGYLRESSAKRSYAWTDPDKEVKQLAPTKNGKSHK